MENNAKANTNTNTKYEYTVNNWNVWLLLLLPLPVAVYYIWYRMEIRAGGRAFYCLIIAKIAEYKWSFRSNRSIYLCLAFGKGRRTIGRYDSQRKNQIVDFFFLLHRWFNGKIVQLLVFSFRINRNIIRVADSCLKRLEMEFWLVAKFIFLEEIDILFYLWWIFV